MKILLTVHALGGNRVQRSEEFLVPLEAGGVGTGFRDDLSGLAEVEVDITRRLRVKVVLGTCTNNIGICRIISCFRRKWRT
jgi:hypothetical protein